MRASRILACIAILAAAGCTARPDTAELDRLRQEKVALEAELERLRAENRRLRGQPETASAVAQFFSSDARAGTLAGLVPGDFIPKARQLFGRETRMDVYVASDRVSQYEWELVGGVTLRLGADDRGRIFRIGVLLDTAQPAVIPTLEGVTLGRDTYADIEEKFGQALWVNLHLWGVRGIYSVAQTLERGPARPYQLQFAYELPPGLSQAQLDRIRTEVLQHRNTGYLMQFVADRIPYLVVLEEPR